VHSERVVEKNGLLHWISVETGLTEQDLRYKLIINRKKRHFCLT
jgi:hypothetical protein